LHPQGRAASCSRREHGAAPRCTCSSLNPAFFRTELPTPIDLIWNRKTDPGKVFDLTLPLDQVAEGYRVIDERRAIKGIAVSRAHVASACRRGPRLHARDAGDCAARRAASFQEM
jgi:hypothetical protein